MKKKIISIIGMAVALNWLSIFFSYKKLNNLGINQPIATGGFPLKIFSYPFPPMGHDLPPRDAWPIFFLNLTFWLIVTTFIFILLGKKIDNPFVLKLSIISAVVLSVFGLFYLMLKFD